NLSDEIAAGDLEKSEVSCIGDGGRPNKGQRTRFGGHDGNRDGPPGHILSAEKVIFNVRLSATEQSTEHCSSDQVGAQNGIVQQRKSHGRPYYPGRISQKSRGF